MFHIRLIAAFTICSVGLASAAGPAEAQVEPFKVSGGGFADFIPLSPADGPAHHCAVGTATHLGNYYADGQAQIDFFTGPTTAAFSSAVPVVFIAADGSELHFDYQGEVALMPADGGLFVTVWVAEFVPAAGTGRFADVVDGSFIMTAVTDPFAFGDTDVPYTWEGDGYIEFDR